MTRAWHLSQSAARNGVLPGDEQVEHVFERRAVVADAGSLSARIAGKRPLHDVVDAYDRIESKRTAGTIVFLP